MKSQDTEGAIERVTADIDLATRKHGDGAILTLVGTQDLHAILNHVSDLAKALTAEGHAYEQSLGREDEWATELDKRVGSLQEAQAARIAAEAHVSRLEEALRQIERDDQRWDGVRRQKQYPGPFAIIARQALTLKDGT